MLGSMLEVRVTAMARARVRVKARARRGVRARWVLSVRTLVVDAWVVGGRKVNGGWKQHIWWGGVPIIKVGVSIKVNDGVSVCGIVVAVATAVAGVPVHLLM